MRVIRCDCGFEAHGDEDEELVNRAQAHAREAHDVAVAADVLLGLARPTPQTHKE